MPARRREGARSALELLDDAAQLLSSSGPLALSLYTLGVVPFLLLLGFFVDEMAHGNQARSELGWWTLALCLAFCWMRVCQALFCCELLRLHSKSPRPISLGFGRALLQVMLWQPLGLIAGACALPLVVPFGLIVSFNYHAAVLWPEPEGRPLARALRDSLLWPFQSHWLQLVAFLAFLIVALNAGALLLLAPILLRGLFGLETRLAEGGFNPLNSSIASVAYGTAYLAIDPLLRTAYTLRTLRASSARQAADLRARLRAWARVAIAASSGLGLFLLAGRAAAGPAASTREFDRTLDTLLAEPEFAWRAASPEQPAQAVVARGAHLLSAAESALAELLSRALDWLRKAPGPDESTAVAGFSLGLVWLLLALSLIIGAASLVHTLRRRGPTDEPRAERLASSDRELPTSLASPDSARWQRLADELVARGELRLALRALFQSALSSLDERGLIAISSHKSAADHATELVARPELASAFDSTRTLFERAFYGAAEVDLEYLAHFRARSERMLAIARARAVSWVLLAVLLGCFVYGSLALLRSRFDSGDIYPRGSSLRADPQGTRLLYLALTRLGFEVEQNLDPNPRPVRAPEPSTLIVAGVDTCELQTGLTALRNVDHRARRGARVLLFLDETALACIAGFGDAARLARRGQGGPNLLGSWGLWPALAEPGWPSFAVRDEDAPPVLPERVALSGRVVLAELSDEWRVLMNREGWPVVAERALGDGSLVVVTSTFPLTNEAMRSARSSEFLAFLFPKGARLSFDEVHLGISRERGVVHLLGSLHLHGALIGITVSFLLFAWHSAANFGPRATRETPELELRPAHELSQLLARAVPERDLLEVCVRERLAVAEMPERERLSLAALAGALDPVAKGDLAARYNALVELFSGGPKR